MSNPVPPEITSVLHKGTVIPAHPLVLTEMRDLDEERQRRLTRYYLASGAGGIAVGVHTTQFEIREPGVDLLEPLLEITADEIDRRARNKPVIKVAGICGPVKQAVEEAILAAAHGYHLGLVSMGGLAHYSEKDLLERARNIAGVIPVFGFCLQEEAGGRHLSYQFWREFVEIPNVAAIKIAAFNRYRTLDVVRAVIDSERRDEIALYTGNDDHIVEDLLTPFRRKVNGEYIVKRFTGGLLGQWAVWTSRAVELLDEIKKLGEEIPSRYLSLAAEITEANAAIFDAANNFQGCIPGVHEILRRQGLVKGSWCLNHREILSPGQAEEIERVCSRLPYLNDDDFVREFLESEKP